jgi:cyclic pyranopterin phosphate synthase
MERRNWTAQVANRKMTFSHLDEKGGARMVDVSAKEETKRTAVAEGFVVMKPETLKAILDHNISKGNVIEVARVAGIMAAKKTDEIIPLCHTLFIESVQIDIEPVQGEPKIKVTATVVTTGKTGVEMEALTSVSVACLAIIDMAKAIDKGMLITDIRLLKKTGGKSGDYVWV